MEVSESPEPNTFTATSGPGALRFWRPLRGGFRALTHPGHPFVRRAKRRFFCAALLRGSRYPHKGQWLNFPRRAQRAQRPRRYRSGHLATRSG